MLHARSIDTMFLNFDFTAPPPPSSLPSSSSSPPASSSGSSSSSSFSSSCSSSSLLPPFSLPFIRLLRLFGSCRYDSGSSSTCKCGFTFPDSVSLHRSSAVCPFQLRRLSSAFTFALSRSVSTAFKNSSATTFEPSSAAKCSGVCPSQSFCLSSTCNAVSRFPPRRGLPPVDDACAAFVALLPPFAEDCCNPSAPAAVFSSLRRRKVQVSTALTRATWWKRLRDLKSVVVRSGPKFK
mmetsp:Transcript_14322/g.35675  ORF Transcript_14322/g.35675 Transcript_14322/m.35675 type:complete len:237 (+) Transcript_14322:2760-3470(+)